MYAAPPAVETGIFARLPDALRAPDRVTPMEQLLGIKFDSFLEGPSFDTEGNLYCVDIPFGRILRLDPAGRFELFLEYDGLPNGLKIHRDGRLFVADRRRGIVAIDPRTRELVTVVAGVELEPFRGPNDLVFAANGDLYFTDQGMSDLAQANGRVFRLRASGQLDLVLEGLPGPNGIALDASERTLFVALTRANSILRAVLLPDGRASRVQTFIQMSGGGGPDGIAVDDRGGLAVAHPQMGAVWLFDARGRPTLRIDLCEGDLGTNLAFGGPAGRTLYITESLKGAIHTVETPVAGLGLYSHAEGA